MDLIGVGATAFLAGFAHLFAGDQIQALVEPWPYVALLAVTGAVNLALAFTARSSATGVPARTGPRMPSATRETSPTT